MSACAASCVLFPMTGLGQTEATSPYTPPRTADGHADLQGIWQVLNTAAWDLEDHGASLGIPAGQSVVEGGTIPYLESALEQRKVNSEQRATLDPEKRCYLPGVPRITYMPYPFQIIQQAEKVTIAYEYLRTVRYIHMNGNPHPPGPIDWWMGDSRGHWEGNTLIVEVTNLNGKSWFDSTGHFFSENTRMIERLRLADADTIDYEITIEDPTIYARPWKMNFPKRRPSTGPQTRGSRIPGAVAAGAGQFEDPYANEYWEVACYEGNGPSAASLRELGFQWFRGVAPPTQ